jgi:hypothetical protein
MQPEITNSILAFVSMYSGLFKANDKWKEKIKKEWKESVNLPRKKKKLKRKELWLDWQIASWEPLKYITTEQILEEFNCFAK